MHAFLAHATLNAYAHYVLKVVNNTVTVYHHQCRRLFRPPRGKKTGQEKATESSSSHSGPAPKVYQKLGLRVNLKCGFRHFAHPSPKFTGREGLKTLKIVLDFRSQSSLSRPRLEMEQCIRNLKQMRGVPMIDLCPLRIWCRGLVTRPRHQILRGSPHL